jgi:GntR family transcriptional regulator/MocR family aminotransferase
MKKSLPFILIDDNNAAIPFYRQIYASIRAAILKGELSAKTRLPSTRDLASQLSVSRITVVNAYEQLFAEGYLEGKTGSGTFVAATLPDDFLRTEKTNQKRIAAKRKSVLNLSPFGENLLMKELETSRQQSSVKYLPFQNGLTAIDQFPFEIWAKIAAKFQKNPPLSLLIYGDSQGYFPLREAIANHLKSARGVNCTAEQIVITAGAQQALDLTARIFLSENDSVLVENPCYIEARNSFLATKAKVQTVEVDEEGLNVAKIPKNATAKLIYVTPSHQYPLGVTMSLSRRLALLEWAKQQNAWIIEDDYNSEFRYSGRPLASLQGLDKTGQVIYVGTFSKTVFPSLRIGCVVLPPQLVEIFTAARALNDVHSSTIEQAILAEFISEGHFARHIRRMRTLYETRQQILVGECQKHLTNLLEIEKADAGMHLVGWLPENIEDEPIALKAREKGLIVSPISRYSNPKFKRGGLILGYTAFDERRIKEGVQILKGCLENY